MNTINIKSNKLKKAFMHYKHYIFEVHFLFS